MSQQVITTLLSDKSAEIYDPAVPTMIDVSHVTMDFNSASQQLNSLKEYFIAAAKRELMFKRFRALDDISLTVQKGDVFGILGTNGSGKSTLLKIVSGVLDPTEGIVAINGNIAPLIELGAGFDYELTARENIYLNGALLGYPKPFIDEHFDAIVDFAEIRPFLDMPLKNYSSGMVSRIAFAIATIIVPEILIVDEVLSVGDFMFQQKCEKRIQKLIHEHGTTVLIVSHSSDQIERLCNKAIWIEKGHVRMVGTAREVSQAYQALGGHEGSPEAERKIFEYVANDTPPLLDISETVAGADHYDTNAAVVGKMQATEHFSKVIIAWGESLSAQMAALSLAGNIGGIVLLTDRDHLPHATLTMLAAIGPQQVWYLAPPNADNQVLSSLRAAIPRSSSVETIDYESIDDLTAKISILAGKVTGGLTPQECERTFAVVTGEALGSASATFAPLIARGCPYFAITKEELIGRTLEHISESGIERVVILGQGSLLTAFAEKAAGDGLQVTHLEDKRCDEDNDAALRWLAEFADAGNKSAGLYLCAREGVVDALSVAPLAASDNGLMLMVDHNDMESMGRAVDIIEQYPTPIDRITYLGSDVCFNNIDKMIIGRAVGRRNG
ncbi:ATP-binding cassette domain-containing protein [Adlercreutzia mucosicola]|uniref:ATP-binding cassette domain-containing protein n=1 Tax=Adlercreutzia mucosicola TaxID=580026 RepID=UPI0003FFF7BB|nr:ATP-binding cassette domain-containing protein [Adlercreutzia mucosicola]MCR2034221.1 ATP-binding cassette domain-containing protein [Adlercreutzia mucosicola]